MAIVMQGILKTPRADERFAAAKNLEVTVLVSNIAKNINKIANVASPNAKLAALRNADRDFKQLNVLAPQSQQKQVTFNKVVKVQELAVGSRISVNALSSHSTEVKVKHTVMSKIIHHLARILNL
ncbi:TPA: hypothetical protein ACY2HE_004303 [Yersinia enterocolitica]